MKIFAFGVLHETLSLKGLQEHSTLKDFKESYWVRNKAGQHGNPPEYWALALQRWHDMAKQQQDSYSEGLATAALPSAPLVASDYEKIKQVITDDLKNYLGEQGLPDAIMLNLHGAMIAEGCLDCEGDIVSLVR